MLFFWGLRSLGDPYLRRLIISVRSLDTAKVSREWLSNLNRAIFEGFDPTWLMSSSKITFAISDPFSLLNCILHITSWQNSSHSCPLRTSSARPQIWSSFFPAVVIAARTVYFSRFCQHHYQLVCFFFSPLLIPSDLSHNTMRQLLLTLQVSCAVLPQR